MPRAKILLPLIVMTWLVAIAILTVVTPTLTGNVALQPMSKFVPPGLVGRVAGLSWSFCAYESPSRKSGNTLEPLMAMAYITRNVALYKRRGFISKP